jgi:hypothetical protein
LALGPVLKVGGQILTWQVGGAARQVPLPYAILQGLPFYDWGRTPGRMITLAMLALSLLVALGVDGVLRRVDPVSWHPLLVMVFIAVVIVDHLFVWPWPLGDAQVPEFYEDVAGHSEDFAILDLPLWDYLCERYHMYYATVHGHRIVAGSVTRRSPQAEEAMRRVERLALPVPERDLEAPSKLAQENIRYVILHKNCYLETELGGTSDYLSAILGPAIYDDERIRVYLVPEG